MQVQVFKHSGEFLGGNVLKINLTAVLSDKDGAPVVDKSINFNYGERTIKTVPTNDAGEAKTGDILIEIGSNADHLIMAIPEGMAIRGSYDFSEIKSEKRGNKSIPNFHKEAKLDRPIGFKTIEPIAMYLFTAAAVIGSTLFNIGYFVSLDVMNYERGDFLMGMGVLIGLPGLIGVIVIFVHFIYQAWKGIQVEGVDVCPEHAAGFLFIPFYNLYWVFVAVYSLINHYNRLNEEYKIGAPKAPVTDALVMSIGFVLFFITGGVFPMSNFVIFWGMVMVFIKMRKIGLIFQQWKQAQAQ